jgi:hypothetical protein
VDVHDVLGQRHVALLVMLVLHDEDRVEPGANVTILIKVFLNRQNDFNDFNSKILRFGQK